MYQTRERREKNFLDQCIFHNAIQKNYTIPIHLKALRPCSHCTTPRSRAYHTPTYNQHMALLDLLAA
jgi:hypothetical protein